jgi:hypothetical protein
MMPPTSNAHSALGGHAETLEESTVAGYYAETQQFELSTSSRLASISARADRSKGGEST